MTLGYRNRKACGHQGSTPCGQKNDGFTRKKIEPSIANAGVGRQLKIRVKTHHGNFKHQPIVGRCVGSGHARLD